MFKNKLILVRKKSKKSAREHRLSYQILKQLNLLNLFTFPNGSPLTDGYNCDYIYIRLHRVGGTSTGMALGIEKLHFTSREAINVVGLEKWQSAYKFAFVRNPFAKAVSTYNHFLNTDRYKMRSKSISFEAWIEKVYGKRKDPKYYFSVKFFQTQSDWLKDHNGEITIDKIAKHENIQEEFTEILEHIGIDAPLPYLNSSKKVDYRSYYNENSFNIVKHWHQEDLDNFGYTFDNG